MKMTKGLLILSFLFFSVIGFPAIIIFFSGIAFGVSIPFTLRTIFGSLALFYLLDIIFRVVIHSIMQLSIDINKEKNERG